MLVSVAAVLITLCPMIHSVKVIYDGVDPNCCSVCKDGSLAERKSKIPDGYVRANSNRNVYYKHFKEKLSWHHAHLDCLRQGANLFYPRDQAEAKDATRVMKKNTKEEKTFFHLGVLKINGNWVSLKGSYLSDSVYYKWKSGEPASGSQNICASMSHDAVMKSGPCFNVLLRYICEIRVTYFN